MPFTSAAWRPWVLLGVFSLTGFLINAATFNSLGVVLPKMVADEGWNWREAGEGFTLLGAACGFSSFAPAFLIRRAGVRVTLVLGAVVMAGGFAALALAHGLTPYFIGAALCGVGYQMMSLIPATHVLAAIFPHRARPFGIYFTACALGGVAGPWMAEAALTGFHDQWRLFWQILVLVSLALGLVSAALAGSRRWLAQASERTDREVAVEVAAPQRLGVYRTAVDWTVKQAVRTPQFYVLLAAYFGHLFVGVSVASLAVAHLTERHVAMTVAVAMLSVEALAQMVGRAIGGVVGERVEPRLLLIAALASLTVGAGALSIAHTYATMLVFAVGSGIGFGLTAFSVTMLLLNYFGRKHNLEIFSLTCLIGGVSALGSTIGGALRDASGGFSSTFEIYAGVIAVILLGAVLMRPPRMGGGPRSAPAVGQAGLAQDHA
ncbi:MFS transporter [Phenylobacterium montanum]|uniref:MFS transporter n=2 Tax=Phenylobacterium montanum TaxID=2823693 RepID=A0A975G4R6_9CAUL|nr:MFS transporter [Caulobacter sp. S6]